MEREIDEHNQVNAHSVFGITMVELKWNWKQKKKIQEIYYYM